MAGAINTVGAAGSGLQLGARFLPVSQGAAGALGTAGNALSTVGGLASLGYGLANGSGNLTPAQASGYTQAGLAAARSGASLLGATGAAGAIGNFAPMAGAFSAGLGGVMRIANSDEGRQYDPAVDRTMGAIQLAGALLAVPTAGLSLLAAPVIDAIGGALGMYDPTHYNALRMRQAQVGQRALQEVAGGYAQAAQTGDPAQGLAALGHGAGDVRGQARLPVRSALDPVLAQRLGLSGGAFDAMSQADYQKVLDYFAADPARLTVLQGNELGGSGAGAIQGSGDVAYLDQQAAQQLQYNTGRAAQNLIRAQLLDLYPAGTSPKLDAVRRVLEYQRLTPTQIAALPADAQARVKSADPQFDPWASANPVMDYGNSFQAVQRRAAVERERQAVFNAAQANTYRDAP